MVFSVTILGSGAALPTSQRFPSAQALQLGECLYLIDCAEGTQIQLRRFHLKINQLKAIFISHLHGDHVFGLPGLLSSLNLLGRTEPLDIFGPVQVDEWLTAQSKFFTPLLFPVHFHVSTGNEPEMVYENKHFSVVSFPLKHRIPTRGYLFREKTKPLNIRKDMISFYQIPLRDILAIKEGGDFLTEEGKVIPNRKLTHPPLPVRSYAYCSDTVYLEHLHEIVQHVDLLYHEATYANDERERSKETFHATAEEAAKVAKAANAGKLVIGHFSSRYRDTVQHLQEARAIFENTEAAEDGKTFEIKQERRLTQ
ncbi:MAG: ribonuclease Z [Bacteroidales bacterium]|jgi:ribonuclease Z|nr:ribonuclease Z [Bacteroidales bacterium]